MRGVPALQDYFTQFPAGPLSAPENGLCMTETDYAKRSRISERLFKFDARQPCAVDHIFGESTDIRGDALSRSARVRPIFRPRSLTKNGYAATLRCPLRLHAQAVFLIDAHGRPREHFGTVRAVRCVRACGDFASRERRRANRIHVRARSLQEAQLVCPGPIALPPTLPPAFSASADGRRESSWQRAPG